MNSNPVASAITDKLGVAKRIRYLTPYYKALAVISAVEKGEIKIVYKGSHPYLD